MSAHRDDTKLPIGMTLVGNCCGCGTFPAVLTQIREDFWRCADCASDYCPGNVNGHCSHWQNGGECCACGAEKIKD